MDWYLPAGGTAGIAHVRGELGRYLRRHAAPDSDFTGAELAASELMTNAIVHAQSPAWIHVDWAEDEPLLVVHDLGPGFEIKTDLPTAPDVIGGRGLPITAALTKDLQVAAKRAGGSRVSARLPIRRASQATFDPLVRRDHVLPADEEADEDGTFGKESFLRALVVQLAQNVEAQQGPDAAEAAVAQVGMDVGGRMEEHYRRVNGIVGQLSREQMADLYVRLKAAIDGSFYVVEIAEDRIVLGNRACPFGEVVKRAPGLCRMTSSVFGGIAARNSDGASVVLEERIAVGDPECRVVVWLGGDHRGRWESAHDYAASPEPS